MQCIQLRLDVVCVCTSRARRVPQTRAQACAGIAAIVPDALGPAQCRVDGTFGISSVDGDSTVEVACSGLAMAVKVLLAKCVGGCTYVVRHAGHGVRPARRERGGTEGVGGGVRMSSARNVATESCRVNRARGSLWLQAEKGLVVSMRCGRVGEVCCSQQSWVLKATDLGRGGQQEGAVGRVGDGYGTEGGGAGAQGVESHGAVQGAVDICCPLDGWCEVGRLL